MEMGTMLRRRRPTSRTERLAAQIDALRDDLEALAEAVGEGAVDPLARRARAGIAEAEAVVRQARRGTRRAVGRQPEAALGAALLFGAAIGYLLARR